MTMKSENLFLYAVLALVTYKALASSSASASPSVQVIPSDEPLRLVPEPPSLALTIPALRGDTMLNGLGERECRVVAKCMDDGVSLGALRRVSVNHCVEDGLGGVDRLGDIFPYIATSSISSPFNPPYYRPPSLFSRRPSFMYPVPRVRGFG